MTNEEIQAKKDIEVFTLTSFFSFFIFAITLAYDLLISSNLITFIILCFTFASFFLSLILAIGTPKNSKEAFGY